MPSLALHSYGMAEDKGGWRANLEATSRNYDCQPEISLLLATFKLRHYSLVCPACLP